MAAPRRTPWIAVDVDGRKDDRIVALPNDSARYGYFLAVLAEARLSTPRGQFASRAHLKEAIGRFDRFVPKYLEVGLLEEAPKLCAGCRKQLGQLRSGTIIVHNWIKKQSDPRAAMRAETWRAEHGDDDANERPSNAEQTPIERPLNADRTDTPRARAETQTLDTRQKTPKEDPVVPSVRPRTQPAARSSVFGIEPTEPEHPVAQILATRFRYRDVSEAQWERLHQIVDNEYPTGTAKGRDRHAAWRWLAELMANLGRDDGDPIDAAFTEVNRRIRERLGAVS